MLPTLRDPTQDAIALTPLQTAALEPWLDGQHAATRRWVAASGFRADAGSTLLVPGTEGALGRVLVGMGKGDDPWVWGGLATSLPPGDYRIDAALDRRAATWAAFAWAAGGYAFERYRKVERRLPVLAWPDQADRDAVRRMASATALVRDLVNTPAEDLGPAELAASVRDQAHAFGAECSEIVGDDLLAHNYPAIHAVGRASTRAPRLVELVWGNPGDPLVALVGKGVCFDSGGLDIKPSAGMLLMKKDMGGAAHVLGIARMVMMAGLPVRLRVLIPAVENVIAGNAFRPLDVLRTRKGLSVEVGNTDAEGRLILCDALHEAASQQPDLLIDFATLTGAARVALGPDLPALFSNDDGLADRLLAAGIDVADPLWRLPLYQPYRKYLDSKVADINNAGGSPFAGAITAGLFLNAFVPEQVRWAHLDTFAWNPAARPGRPEGGEALGMRAVYELLERNYACKR